jgi:hypothetical protein
MSSDLELVQIDASEDANAVKDRLSFFRGRRVMLVWPEEGTALTRKLDLVLIQREAMRRQIRLALVTHDPQVMKHAGELNISTFETIGTGERSRWKRGRSKVFTSRKQRPKDNPNAEELKPVASRLSTATSSFSRLQRLSVRVGLFAVFLAVLGGLVYLVVPTATVTLFPAQQTITVSVEVRISMDSDVTAVDVENAVIPSRLLSVLAEQEWQVETTGEVTTGNIQATGDVVFTNATADELEIPAGTLVSTTDGSAITFETTDAATLPAGEGSEITVPIVARANDGGDAGNVGANRINTVVGPLEDQVIVLNPSPTTGGQAQTARVVTEVDRQRVARNVRQLLQQAAFSEMPNLPGVSMTNTIISETLTIEEPPRRANYSAQAGDRADLVTLRMQAVVNARAYDEQQARQVVYAWLAREIPRGREIQPETVQYESGPIRISEDAITFTMTGSSVVAGRVEEGDLRNTLAGMTVDEALEYIQTRLDIEPGTTPEIVLSPNWTNRLPLWADRITVDVRTVIPPADEAITEIDE